MLVELSGNLFAACKTSGGLQGSESRSESSRCKFIGHWAMKSLLYCAAVTNMLVTATESPMIAFLVSH